MLILFFNGSIFRTSTWWFQSLVTGPRQPKLHTQKKMYYCVNRLAVEEKFRGFGCPDHLERSDSWWSAILISIAISSEERKLTATYSTCSLSVVSVYLKRSLIELQYNRIKHISNSRTHKMALCRLVSSLQLHLRSRCPKFRACVKKDRKSVV